jgi:hypothetical protein
MEMLDFLQMLSGPAGWVALGTFFSVVLAKWSWFAMQSSGVKQTVVIALSVLVSVLSHVVFTYTPANVMQALAPYWVILYGTIATYTSSQVMHRLKK